MKKPTSTPTARRSYARRAALIAKARKNPTHIVDKYLSLLGKYARASR